MQSPPPPNTRGTSLSSTIPKQRKRLSGFAWIFIAIAAVFVLGAVISALRTQRAPTPRANARSLNENFFGVEEFANAPEGGVTFNDVYPPDGPADKAGLVGGDIIKTVDGRAVNQSKDIFDLLRATPTGKTLEINYVRDGEGRTTKLTTISEEQFDGLIEKFEDRAEGHGQLGYEDIATRVIALPGSNISGVQLHRLGSSGPAVLAGVQEGDIVIAVDGVPIRKRGELIQRVRRAVPYSTIKLVVMRGNQRLEIPVKVGKR